MLLKNFKYSEFENDVRFWVINSFELEKINLFTAKNATGKTRTIDAIYWLSLLIMDQGFKSHANFTVDFLDESDNYHYFLKIENMKVIYEKLVCNDKTLLSRDESGKGKIYTAQIGDIEFQSPENKLAISRRDKIQYPYLEKIHLWANNFHHYSFGTSMKQEYGKAIDDKQTVLHENSDNSVEIFAIGENKFDKEFKESILSSMNSIGYEINIIDIQGHLYSDTHVRFEDYTLYVSEKENDTIIYQSHMSQGMFRALSIIIHLTYHTMMKTQTTILIDDIGEGLDFERSTKLIKLLIELAEKNDNIQLIMSTNDRFVMNNVPLEYWQVIQRKGGECHIYNYHNSKDIFDEFAYTGLNNFDFLATDFLNPEK